MTLTAQQDAKPDTKRVSTHHLLQPAAPDSALNPTYFTNIDYHQRAESREPMFPQKVVSGVQRKKKKCQQAQPDIRVHQEVRRAEGVPVTPGLISQLKDFHAIPKLAAPKSQVETSDHSVGHNQRRIPPAILSRPSVVLALPHVCQVFAQISSILPSGSTVSSHSKASQAYDIQLANENLAADKGFPSALQIDGDKIGSAPTQPPLTPQLVWEKIGSASTPPPLTPQLAGEKKDLPQPHLPFLHS